MKFPGNSLILRFQHMPSWPTERVTHNQGQGFVASLYIRVWFEATSSAKAPANDLLFLKKLSQSKYSNSKIQLSRKQMSAFSWHLGYLSEEMVGLAFFNSSVTEEQRKLRDADQWFCHHQHDVFLRSSWSAKNIFNNSPIRLGWWCRLSEGY